MNKVLVVSPHMDDAYLCLGGAITQWKRDNLAVTVLIVFGNDACTLTNEGTSEERIAIRRNEESINANLTGSELWFWDYPSGWPARGYGYWDDEKILESDLALIDELEERMNAYIETGGFDVVFGPAGVGAHIDHRIVRTVLTSVNKPQNGSVPIFLYEDLPYALDTKCWSRSQPFPESEVRPFCIDIGEVLDSKAELLGTYESQLTPLEQELTMQYAVSPATFMPAWLIPEALNCSQSHPSERVWINSSLLTDSSHALLKYLGFHMAS